MNDGNTQQRPTVGRLRHVALDLGLGHAGIVLERQRGYWLAAFGPSADADKCDHRANVSPATRKLCRFRGGIERLAL